MSHPSTPRPIGTPQSLSRHKSHGTALRTSKSRSNTHGFKSGYDAASLQASAADLSVQSSLASEELKLVFGNMLFYHEFMRRSVASGAPHGLEKHGEHYRQAVKLVITKVQQFPEDLQPSVACIAAQQSALAAVDGFVRAARGIRFADPNLRNLLARASDRLDMSMTTLVMLLQMSEHEIEEGNRKQQECWNSSESTLAMTPEDAKAHESDPKARPLSYIFDKTSPKPRSRKSTLLGAMRKMSGLNLRRADSCAAFVPKPLIQSKCKGTVMLANLGGSIASVTPEMRDTMTRFMVNGAMPVVNGLNGVGAPHLEYRADKLLYKANIRGLVAVLTSSCGAENQEYAAMVLMTFRFYSHAISLAEALLLRYTEDAPTGIAKDQYRAWLETMVRVKQRVVFVLHQWFECDWKPEDRPAFETLDLLIRDHIGSDSPSDRDALLRSLEPCRKDPQHFGTRHLTPNRPISVGSPKSPTSFGRRHLTHRVPRTEIYWDITPFRSPEGIEEFARQLTLVESKMYHRLCPEDWIDLNRPDAVALRMKWGEDFGNGLNDWVFETVLRPNTPEERARGFDFWALVAKVRPLTVRLEFPSNQRDQLEMRSISQLLLRLYDFRHSADVCQYQITELYNAGE